MYNKELNYYELFHPFYLKNKFEKTANIYSALFTELVNFFYI